VGELEATVEIDWDDDGPAPFVEVLYHVDLDRIGDVTGPRLFAENDNRVTIGRNWPEFGQKGLEDPCISRAQVGIVWAPARETFRIEPCPGAARDTWYWVVGEDFRDIPLAGMDVKPGSIIAVDDRLLLRVDFRPPSYPDNAIWGLSPIVERLRASVAERVSRGGSVWLEGGVGSGKLSLCREIHKRSTRSEGPFVSLRCAELADDKKWKRRLFGDNKEPGLFREAEGGVLVLHRMENLASTMQESIAEVVASGSIKPVGVRARVPVDVWCFGTIGRESIMDLPPAPELARAFGIATVSVPELTDYRSDVPVLFTRYLKRTCIRMPGVDRLWQTPSIASCLVPMSFYLKLLGAKWSGNVRQVQRLVVAAAKANRDAEGEFIEPEWPSDTAVDDDPLVAMGRELVTETRLRKLLYRHEFVVARVSEELQMDEPDLLQKMQEFGINHPSEFSLEFIRDAKDTYGDSVEQMAEGLQVPALALLNRIKELGIQF
jgi:DNA-binding NtrC family response regulator